MTDVPVAFGPWLNVTLDAMKLMAQDSSDVSDSPDAINLGCAITLTPIVEEGTILSYLNTGYYPGTLEWLAGPAGWTPPKEYEHLDYVEYPFAQNIVNLADEDLPTDANTYTVRMELIDTRNGNSLGTLSGNLICTPSVLTMPLLSTIKQLAPPPGDVTVNMLPVDGTIPEGWLIVKSGGSTVGLDPATFKGDAGPQGPAGPIGPQGPAGVDLPAYQTSLDYFRTLPGRTVAGRDVPFTAVRTTAYYFPIRLLGDWTPSALSIKVNTPVGDPGDVAYIWIFEADNAEQPGTLVLNATPSGLPVNTAGVKEVTGLTTTFPSGNYVAVLRVASASVNVGLIATTDNGDRYVLTGSQVAQLRVREGVTWTDPSQVLPYTASYGSSSLEPNLIFWR